jgi:hypothetical protein
LRSVKETTAYLPDWPSWLRKTVPRDFDTDAVVALQVRQRRPERRVPGDERYVDGLEEIRRIAVRKNVQIEIGIRTVYVGYRAGEVNAIWYGLEGR